MTLWQALMRLLATLAVVSLSLAPVTASAAAVDAAAPVSSHAMTMGDADAAMAMDEMPCCPPDKSVMPDCQKDCPLAALCLAKLTTALPVLAGVPVRTAISQTVPWRASTAFRSLLQAPLPKPPRP